MTLISMFEHSIQHPTRVMFRTRVMFQHGCRYEGVRLLGCDSNKPALAHKPKGGTYQDISYTELGKSVDAFSKGINALGVQKNDRVDSEIGLCSVDVRGVFLDSLRIVLSGRLQISVASKFFMAR